MQSGKGASLSCDVKNNAIYNSAIWSVPTGGSGSFTTSDNIINDGTATLFPNMSNGITMTLPDDIDPTGTALVDVGESSILTVDLLNDSRDTPPEIGPLEEQAPATCWRYTARYKNSSRLFTANGPGDFPKSLNVPGNVDKSSGRMIDEGRLIGPNRYDVD